ncbi:hypothetical protein YTPLAS18_14990 [Nitrospira sp.]|nr:hypothetical protein YTPLAS18_14990 [Nitrospira sp.]
MLKILMFCLTLLGGSAYATLGFADDPMDEKSASPSLGERLMKDSITGTLMKMDGQYYVIQDEDGKQHRVHVDKSTKLDKMIEGDKVKAYITDKGHATTLQRKEE